MEKLVESMPHTFDIRPYLVDRGWDLSPNPTTINRRAENSGEIKLLTYRVLQNNTYYYSLKVSNLTTGGLKVIMNGVESPLITTNGFHEGTITSGDDLSKGLVLWADCDGTISEFTIKPDYQEGFNDGMSTITWSEQREGWVSFKDFIPESGFSVHSNMYTLKGGELWKHDVTATPNNFYGIQYTSSVKFPVSSMRIKTFHSIAIHSNQIMGTTQDGITTELGQVSDLISYDFSSVEGVHYANLLRDSLTGDKLKGRYIVLELTNEETNSQHLQLFKIVLKSNVSTVNE